MKKALPFSKKFYATAQPKSGGARRDRTADLLRAKQALSQLSYGPGDLVGLGGFDGPTYRPPTSPVPGQ